MIIPTHVRRMAENIQIELEQQIQNGGHKGLLEHRLKAITEIRQEMINKKGKFFENDDEYVNMLELMTAIMEASYDLWAPAAHRIYQEVEIEPELSFALNHARIVHPRMRKEIDSLIAFLEDVPNSVWSQDDEYADFRVFKLVKTKKQWERIMEKFSGIDLGIRNFKYLKIGYVENETYVYSLEGIAKKAKDYLEEKLGKDGFYAKRKAFKRWFRIGRTGTYYIYVPK